MRALRFVGAGMGVLFLARLTVGCAGDQGVEPFDAGPLPDVIVSAHDAGQDAAVSALDATVPPADGGSDSATPDASQPGAGHDAGDAGDAAEDAPRADTGAPDAADGAVPVDASDASVVADASDASLAADGGFDAGLVDSSVADAGADVGDSGAAVDASDAAACVACGSPLSFLGNTAAFVSGTATHVALNGGTVPAAGTVSAITQTYPQGSALSVRLVYATDAKFTTQVDAPMLFDKQTGNNDQWYFVIPAQPSGTTVYWYVDAHSCDCTTTDYDPGNLQSFTYGQQ